MGTTDDVVGCQVTVACRPAGLTQGQPAQLSREHWIVPVHGLLPADPNSIMQAIARRDGTVVLHLTCGDSQVEVGLDVCRAAQLSTGIWEAAGTAQRLTGQRDDDQLPPAQPPNGSEDLPEDWRSPARPSAPARARSLKPRRRPFPVEGDAALDARRTIGLRIRRIRHSRRKSLRVISGLAGMSASTLHHVEHGRRELTLSEIVALANALKIAPMELIALPILAPPNN